MERNKRIIALNCHVPGSGSTPVIIFYVETFRKVRSQHLPSGQYTLLFSSNWFIYLAVWGLGCSMWDLVPWPGIEPWPPALEAQDFRLIHPWLPSLIPWLRLFLLLQCQPGEPCTWTEQRTSRCIPASGSGPCHSPLGLALPTTDPASWMGWVLCILS